MIKETARTKMYEAMKEKDAKKKGFYAFLLDQLMKAEKNKQSASNPNPTLSDAEEIDVVQALVKQTRDAIRTMQSKKLTQEKEIQMAKEFVAEREYELALYAEFLPKELTSDEINMIIAETVSELPAPINKGILMKNLMPKVKGKADGKLVAELADKYLANL